MLLEFALVGVATYLGGRALSKRPQKKSLMLDRITEKSLEHHFFDERSNSSALHVAPGKGTYAKAENALHVFRQKHLARLLGDVRHNQLKMVSTSALSQEVDQRISKAGGRNARQWNFNLSVAALGLATASFVYPPLAFASQACIFLSAPDLFHRIYKQIVNERRVTVDTVIGATLVAGVALGAGIALRGSSFFIFLVSLDVFLANYAQRMMRQVREDAQGSLVDVFKQQPTSVWALIDGIEVEISVESVQMGGTVVVNAGETIPIDGKISEGLASIDQHILTGEAQPAEKGPGDQVFALTVVTAGKVKIIVEKTGQETTAAQIGQILNQTMNFKTEMQLWAESMADKSSQPTLLLSALAIPIFGPSIAWALLLAHPKYKPTVATYINLLSYLNVTSHQGILVKDGRIFELLNQVDIVVFDKTGTLTEATPRVGQIYAWLDYTENDILTYAAAAEYRQTHPVATAILQEAAVRALSIPEIEEAAYKVGYGLTVMLEASSLRVGSLRFMEEERLALPVELDAIKSAAYHHGHSLICIGMNRQVIGAIVLELTVRPEAKAVVNGLRERGVKSTYIISGDHEAPTRKLAQDLGIDHYFAETLPEQKANLIEQLQQDGRTVCYVGDGINDAIALKKAAVSISMQGASTVAVDTAQIILMDQNLNKLCTLFELAGDFERNMKKTFGLVVAPHLIGLVGTLFLHFGILPVILLSQLGLGMGVINALQPRFQLSNGVDVIDRK